MVLQALMQTMAVDAALELSLEASFPTKVLVVAQPADVKNSKMVVIAVSKKNSK